MYFRNSLEYLPAVDEMTMNEERHVLFGIPFLDDALDGSYPDDLTIITAATGGGKTEMATNIAYQAAKQGKRVHYFALEAHQGEIEARIKFKLLTQAFFTQKDFSQWEYPDYQKWIHGKQSSLLSKFYPEVNEILRREIKNLHCYYGDHEFNIDMFEGMLGTVGEESDLILLDHAHHISLPDDNENASFKRMIRQIKKIVSFYRKPIIIVAQLRKTDKYSQRLLPCIDDIFGASELAKIATRIVVTAPAKDAESEEKHIFPTYFKILKNRTSGARTYYTALCGYDSLKNEYSKNYILGLLEKDDSKFAQIERWHYPKWCKQEQGQLL